MNLILFAGWQLRFSSGRLKNKVQLLPLQAAAQVESPHLGKGPGKQEIWSSEEISGNLGSVLELTQVGVPVVE